MAFCLRHVHIFVGLVAAIAVPSDRVTSLPSYGPIKGVQYSGVLPINATYDKHLFYWFVEAAAGNVEGKTPLLIWMNGGPGASSITGLLAENIGPIALQLDTKGGGLKLVDNPYTWAAKYNLIIIDNPVGAGFSYTKNGGWVSTEEEMRREFYTGLSSFLAKHPEYRRNPIWVCGESFGGKYVPNVAFEIHQRGELNLKGVITGNGMYKPSLQYAAVPDYAYNQGILDEHSYQLAKTKMDACIGMITQGKNADAAKYCEAVVYWIYGSNETGAGQFYYDLGMADGSFLDDLTNAMGSWLNSDATKEALHVPAGHNWTQSDETGPVSDALIRDFVSDQSLYVLRDLLEARKYQIVQYNGVRDGSVCNHVGNLAALNALPWYGQLGFNHAFNRPFRVNGTMAGYVRNHERLSYYTLLRTGHLVPTVVPEVGQALIEGVVSGGKIDEHWSTATTLV